MIRIEKLVKRFGKLIALNEVDLTLGNEGCLALIGPNASGKTTLIKTILGLVVADSGDVFVNAQSVKNNFQYREDIGYMPQIGRYPDNMTILQLFNMIAGIRKRSLNTCDVELIEQFEIATIYSKRLSTLSGGTRQKISACLAFMFNPGILILDEPTAGLDPISSEILKDKILREKKRGKLILITSHVLSDLDELVDEVLFMQDGKISFRKSTILLRLETGESKLSKALAKAIIINRHEQTS